MHIMEFVKMINYTIMVLFFVCYSYQFLFVLISFFAQRRKEQVCSVPHRIAALIAARNEEIVIGNLIDSLKAQNYPQELLDVYVIADNCTDRTAAVARQHGAIVFERFNKVQIGKGYALNFLLKKIAESGKKPDAYIVFDADNLADPNFVAEMNQSFSAGHEILTCYRNSKNYGDNWISAGCALWFLRESQYLNLPRSVLGSSCAVSGTGFLFSDQILEKCGGWNFFCLTEDIEFTIHSVVNGEKIGYCKNAILYDEQPTKFSQSWKQRQRWAKGYLQVLAKYWKQLFIGILKKKKWFSCFDMTMNIMPATVLTVVTLIINLFMMAVSFMEHGGTAVILSSLLESAINLYLTMFVLGLITVITEWKKIYCPAGKKIFYTFTFPLFMLTYLPICIVAFFKKTEWEPISHTRNMNLSSVCSEKIES